MRYILVPLQSCPLAPKYRISIPSNLGELLVLLPEILKIKSKFFCSLFSLHTNIYYLGAADRGFDLRLGNWTNV